MRGHGERKEGEMMQLLSIGGRRGMRGASMRGQIEAGGDMNQHCDGSQRVRYREVMTRINESGTRVQTQRLKRRGNGNQRRWFRNYYYQNQGTCVITISWPNEKVHRKQDGPKR
jgi:hypothetical protein